MDFLELTASPLSVDSILKLVSSEKCGAVSIFVGTTRDNFEGKQVVKLDYEAYEPMAAKVMKSLCEEIRNKFKEIHNIAIYHRLGSVPVLDASVVIAISSPHRVDSLAAVQYCIENLKEDNLFSSLNKIENDTWNNITAPMQPHLVQINASNEEIQNRIKKYADKKREQINLSNIRDFIEVNGQIKDSSQDESYSTCARVDAVLIKRKDSKSHLQVMRVQNEWGPQTKIEKIDSQKHHDDGLESTMLISTMRCGIEERISNAESRLSIAKPVPKDVYQRLKAIEDRLLELESISPEYAAFWSKTSTSTNESEITNSPKDKQPHKYKVKFTANDIREKIEALQKSQTE